MLVQGAAQLGRLFKVSDVFMGVVVVGLGTSLPEIMTALMAAFKNDPGIATGNVVGSNIANVLLILGTALVLFGQRSMGFGRGRIDYAIMVFATAVLCVLAATWGEVGALQGGGLLLLLGAVFFVLMYQGRQTFTPPLEETLPQSAPLGVAAKTALALAGLWLGSVWLVDGASALAVNYGVPQEVVGLSVVALGTSLPELAATFAAYKTKNGQMILGNVLGSNILNIFAALGLAALVTPLSLNGIWPSIGTAAAAAVAILPLFVLSKPPARFMGLLFLAAYMFYIYNVFG